MATASMRLHRDRFPDRAVLDTAVSHALLRRVARGDAPESLRLYRPDDALLFSSLDARRPGYARAVELARDAGFEPVVRLAGGHAAVFLSSSLAFAWASPDPDAALRIRPRFERLAGWIVAALRRLGLDARVGELEGEYCPGEFSVHVEGRMKVMGVGQRVIRGAAHVGGVVTVGDTDRLREVLVPIYEALELPLRPETAGGIADFDACLTADDLIAALAEVLRAEGIALLPSTFDPAIEDEARALAAHHAPESVARARGLQPGVERGPAGSIATKALLHSGD
ncbi:MAG: lipoate--protein ligase family protein [Myxococcota bacterium]